MTDKEQKEIFAKNLNRLVNSSSKTQTEICKDLGINISTFNMWTRGNSIPSVSKIQTLADYFKVGKSDLVDQKHEVPEYDPGMIELIDFYSKLPQKYKNIIIDCAKAFYAQHIIDNERD